jgi:hypothetical protein
MIKSSSSNNLTSHSTGKFQHSCISREVRSLYLIEPRPSNKEIYDALQNAWRQPNPLNISSEFFIDSSYLTNKK